MNISPFANLRQRLLVTMSAISTVSIFVAVLLLAWHNAPEAQASNMIRPYSDLPVIVAPRPAQPCARRGAKRYGKTLEVTLEIRRAQNTIYNPATRSLDTLDLRSYDGCLGGPELDVLPGDTLRVHIVNRLSTDDPSCPTPAKILGAPPSVGCFNTTNLHTHGLHVSPSGNSDNVLVSIAPQTDFTNEITIPDDHPAGTFWFHAHRHGSTAMQVGSGLAGVLIVRGNREYRAPTTTNPHPIADIDTILRDRSGRQMPEHVFLFEQIAYACFDNDPKFGIPWQKIHTTKGLYDINSDPTIASAPWTCPSPKEAFQSAGSLENFELQLDSPTIWDTSGRFTSVNGSIQPTFTIPAGEIQRWRFVHAGIHDTINVQIVRATYPTRGLYATAAFSHSIATSSLYGNRLQQRNAVEALCEATKNTLIPQFEIANDGLTRSSIHAVDADLSLLPSKAPLPSNFLQPGYRSDILVVFPSDGDYCLLNQSAPPQERASSGKGGGQGPSVPQLLAYVHVRGGSAVSGNLQEYVQRQIASANSRLPARVRQGLLKGDISPWAPYIVLATPSKTVQTADFQIGASGFTINGKSYDPDVVNYRRQVGTTDTWELTAQGEPHIFHIHVNPFKIMDILHDDGGKWTSIYDESGVCKASVYTQDLANQYCGMWHTFRDTIFVENNFKVVARTRYDRYIGEYVLHCHILDHEDGGMMANIEIVPDLSAPGYGLGMPMMSHSSH